MERKRAEPARRLSTYGKLLLGLVIFIVFTEIVLRKIYGFTDMVLFKEDKDFEYIQVPQNRFRFRDHIFYNSLSQRNKEITVQDSVICLGMGDSILDGGSQTDQDSLATKMLSDYLTRKYKRKVIFTSIAAPSWGPDNCYAYLKKYGNFSTKKILLVVSSHDAYDNMNFEKVVDVLPIYPSHQYKLALLELLDRYIYPGFIKKYFSPANIPAKNDSLGINKYKAGMPFNSGFADFKKYCDSAHINLMIYLHAEKVECKRNKYNAQGQQIIAFCQANGIPIIKELDYHFPENAYRDIIHLSERGQHFMYNILINYY